MGINWGEYLYWNNNNLLSPSWDLGSTNIVLGSNAGQNSQGKNAIAVGRESGKNLQGENSIAIGYLAGENSQANNSIILNASGNPLNANNSSFYVSSIRESYQSNYLHYDPSTKEVTYSYNQSSLQFSNTRSYLSAYYLENSFNLSNEYKQFCLPFHEKESSDFKVNSPLHGSIQYIGSTRKVLMIRVNGNIVSDTLRTKIGIRVVINSSNVQDDSKSISMILLKNELFTLSSHCMISVLPNDVISIECLSSTQNNSTGFTSLDGTVPSLSIFMFQIN
jgi:hypothetical protein